ncbi:MAG TPA: glucosaminidase domain-containing protein [Vicinamibacterales bacterium]|nr:glucosaminidase domain-containing protein [Vicinamibacterales bacterium]
MAQVPTIRTVCSTKDYAHAAIVAWRFIYKGALPTKEQVGVLYAQWMVETGGKHCWNWNIGNVKVTPAQVDAGIPWFDLPGTWEIIGGKRVVLGEGDPGRRFRAYASLDAGMAEHMAFLRNKRYAPSWPKVEAGDPDGFARALKTQGYYTAPADQYAAIMVGAHKSWMRSDAFEKALEDVIAASEAETQPDLDVYVSEGPAAFVTVLPDTLMPCARCHRQSCNGDCLDAA